MVYILFFYSFFFIIGVDRVGVAALDEGIELRINGIREVPILLLGVWEAHVAPLFFEHNVKINTCIILL